MKLPCKHEVWNVKVVTTQHDTHTHACGLVGHDVGDGQRELRGILAVVIRDVVRLTGVAHLVIIATRALEVLAVHDEDSILRMKGGETKHKYIHSAFTGDAEKKGQAHAAQRHRSLLATHRHLELPDLHLHVSCSEVLIDSTGKDELRLGACCSGQTKGRDGTTRSHSSRRLRDTDGWVPPVKHPVFVVSETFSVTHGPSS